MTEQDAADDARGDSEPTRADGADGDGAADETEPVAGDAGPDADDRDTESLDDIIDESDGYWERLEDVADGVEPDEDLVERVGERDPEDLAAEFAGLREAVSELEAELAEHEAEVEDLESRLARKQADFQNYKKRQEQTIEDVRARATEDLVTRLLDVRDNLARALEQEEDADIRGGVESTLGQFDEELDQENVAVIEPDAGEETDPTRHEVLMQVDSEHPEGTVDEVHRAGYEMGDKVLRPAQVTVSDG
jgi:molecular chaperone GrpE